MKQIALLFVAIAFAISAEAQEKNKEFKRSDIEFGLGMTFGADNNLYNNGGIGPYLRFEYRYNLKSIPIDLGFQTARSVLKISSDTDDNNKVDTDFIISNYHFFKKHNFDLYGGIGAGLVDFDYFGGSVRVGAKMVKHLNLTLEYMLLQQEDSHAVIALGFFF
ncbi:hypothetical protein [Mangrovibacterium marinum]|uniref:Outer membrane protein with beta-barrel domain n=1 Tax=Mangrovibacterium marinum TaxID=1639118 RepID=A0A2T5C1L6_9BACT|nr:hypothetical protein [Mangrovibacterium marinum]PTN08550.1 hypothetical protein C8N47_108107 [Mangrovibacterium marinum]